MHLRRVPFQDLLHLWDPYLRRTCVKSFATFDRMDCEIITFEVERKVFFHCAGQGQQTLTARGAKFLNYTTLCFCTVVMHIKLGTCVPNLRGRQ
jgi:hypothetical protein